MFTEDDRRLLVAVAVVIRDTFADRIDLTFMKELNEALHAFGRGATLYLVSDETADKLRALSGRK